MNYAVFLLALFTTFLFGCADVGTPQEGRFNMSILKQKPVFTIDFHGAGTRYQFYVNGVLVENNPDALQATTELPVNHWMRSGINTLDLLVYPDDEGEEISSNSQIKASLQVRNYGEQENYPLGGISFDGATYKNVLPVLGYQRDVKDFSVMDDGGIVVSEMAVENDVYFEGTRKYSITIDVPSNLPLWSFFNSDNVPDFRTVSDEDYLDLRLKLYNILRNIQDHLEHGNIDDIMPLFSERNRETDLAFYKEEGQTERELHSDFTNDIPTLNMINLGPESSAYESEENLKLASNFRGDRKNAISGNLKSGTGNLSFPIMFRKQGDKWIITR